MSLPSFTITGTLLDLLGNTALGEIVGNGLGGATPAKVTFTSNVPASDFVTFGGVAYRVDEVTATVGSDGSITRNGDPVLLLANDDGLSVDGVQWQAHIAGMKRFWFNAPTDGGTIDLGSVAPVPGVSLVGLTTLDWNSVTGKPAVIAAGADAAAARAAIGAAAELTPEQFGAVGNGSTNDAAALNSCFAAAAGKTVWLDPSKTYAHNSLVTIGQDGTTVTGGGTLKATNSLSEQSCVLVTGDNVTIDHVTLTCPTASVRRFTGNDCKLQLLTCDGAVVRHVTINGSSNFGFLAQGATNFYVESCLVENAMADGFQSSYGSTNGQFVNCSTVDTGDDGFSVISYAADPAITSNITNRGFSVKNSSARGISVVGGANVRYFDGKIDNTTAAAIYIACELPTNPSYGVSNVVVSNVDVANANSGAPGTITGAVLVYNDRATPYSVDTVSITGIRLRDTDVDAARQISLQNLGTGILTGLELGPMVFSGTVPAAVLFTSGTIGYLNNINLPSFPSKTTPVDADVFAGADSATSNTPAKFTWANIKSGIASYIATLTATWTNKNLTSGTNTFPTFNQNTTGSAASLTTSRNIDGQAFNGTADVAVIAPGTHAATGKTTPVDADELPLVDSAASNVLKKLTFANLKAGLKSYYDTVATTMTNKTLDNPRVSNVIDTNGNTMFAFVPHSSSVNYFLFNNGATGEAAWINVVSGVDSNVSLVLAPQAAGSITGWANSQADMKMQAAGASTDVGWNVATQNAGRVKENGNTVASWVSVPATATSTGKVGQQAADSSWLYICTATNTWRRVAIAAW